MLLGILQQRIELDKECMFQFTQLRKEVDIILSTRGEDINKQFSFSQVRVVDGQTSIAPVLMRYQRGCQQVSAPLTTFVERYRQIVQNISYQRGCQQISALNHP